jgi:hypothetical protein
MWVLRSTKWGLWARWVRIGERGSYLIWIYRSLRVSKEREVASYR